jgi:hypothetical protein
VVHAGEAEGLDAASFHPRGEGDEEPLLLPWGPVAARTYRYESGRFVSVGDAPNPRYRAPAPEQAAPPARQASTPRAPARPAPAAERPPSLEALIAAAKRERGIPASAEPRFRRRANVAEDPRPETLVVYGRSLLVVGPGFRGGRGYFFFDLPARAPEDLLDLSTADVTGDGRDEILGRFRQDLGQGFTREVLVVHRFTPRGFPRALAVEVARTDGTHRVENRVRTTRSGGRLALTIEPGRAVGWDRASWPFAGFADDGVAPLLLPWQDQARRYCLEDGALVPR